jgi:hypothetical protein
MLQPDNITTSVSGTDIMSAALLFRMSGAEWLLLSEYMSAIIVGPQIWRGGELSIEQESGYASLTSCGDLVLVRFGHGECHNRFDELIGCSIHRYVPLPGHYMHSAIGYGGVQLCDGLPEIVRAVAAENQQGRYRQSPQVAEVEPIALLGIRFTRYRMSGRDPGRPHGMTLQQCKFGIRDADHFTKETEKCTLSVPLIQQPFQLLARFPPDNAGSNRKRRLVDDQAKQSGELQSGLQAAQGAVRVSE